MSEIEWEYVARSEGLQSSYPWGYPLNNDNICDYLPRVMCEDDIPAPVCSHDQALSNQGGCDLVGNLAEWTLDEWSSTPSISANGSPYCTSQNQCTGNYEGVIRGASMNDSIPESDSLKRQSAFTGGHSLDVGGRLLRRLPTINGTNPITQTRWVTVNSGRYTNSQDEEIEVRALQVMKHEVTVGQYRVCVNRGDCREPDMTGSWSTRVGYKEEHPVTGISFEHMNEYASWLGNNARLPTQDEWLYIMESTGTISSDTDFTCSHQNLARCMGEGATMGVCLLDDLHDSNILCDAIGNASEMVLISTMPDVIGMIGGSYQTSSDSVDAMLLVENVTLSASQSTPDTGIRLVRDVIP